MTSFGRETVGAAYIRILADMSHVHDDIADSEDEFKKQGGNSAKSYQKGFDDEMDKGGIGRRSIPNSIEKERGRIAAVVEKFAKEEIADKINASVGKNVRLGEIINENVKRDLIEGNLEFKDLADTIGSYVLPATRQLADEQEHLRVVTQKAEEKLSIQNSTARRLTDTTDKLRVATEKARLAVTNQGNDSERSYGRILTSLLRVGAGIDRTSKSLAKFDLGKIFGKGSRNNFINAIGSFVSLLGRVPSLLVGGVAKGFGAVTKVATKMSDAFQDAEGGFMGVAKAGLSLVASLASGAAGIAIMAVGLALLAVVIGPVVAGIAVLAGVVLALASALTVGLIGIVGIAAPALLGLVAIVGTVAAAIAGMSDASKKKLGQLVQPLKDIGKEAGNLAAKNLFGQVAKQVGLITPVLRKQIPLVGTLSTVLANAGTNFAKIFAGKQFALFFATLQGVLPDIANLLSNIFVQGSLAAAGFFRAVLPFTAQFLSAVNGVVTQFAGWINSAKGQNAIFNFFQTAWGIAKTLNTTISDIIQAIGKVISAGGSETGDSFFKSINESLQRFLKDLDPQTIQGFFDKVKNFVSGIGPTIDKVAKAFGDLITPENIARVQSFIGFLGTFAAIAGDIIEGGELVAAMLVALLGPGFRAIGSAIDGIKSAWDATAKFFQSAVDTVIRPALAATVGFFLDFASKVLNAGAFAFGWVPGLGDKLKDARDKFNTFAAGVKADLAGIPKNMPVAISPQVNALAASETAAQLNALAQARIIPFIPAASGGSGRAAREDVNSARGRLVTGRMLSWVGEQGPEAIVPLARPLSQVDPAVRWLSAIAQGKADPGTAAMASGGIVGNPGRVVNFGDITLVSATADPRAVASEFVNEIIAKAMM